MNAPLKNENEKKAGYETKPKSSDKHLHHNLYYSSSH